MALTGQAVAAETGSEAMAANAEVSRSGPPSILFIMVDDLGLYDLHCYGFEAVDTPNADRLAGRGDAFTNAYAAAPACSPARAGVITG